MNLLDTLSTWFRHRIDTLSIWFRYCIDTLLMGFSYCPDTVSIYRDRDKDGYEDLERDKTKTKTKTETAILQSHDWLMSKVSAVTIWCLPNISIADGFGGVE